MSFGIKNMSMVKCLFKLNYCAAIGLAEKVSGASDANGQSEGVLSIHRAEACEVDDVPGANE